MNLRANLAEIIILRGKKVINEAGKLFGTASMVQIGTSL